MSTKSEVKTSKKDTLFFRIIPETITFTDKISNETNQQCKYVLYLDKGMQVIGKSSHFKYSPGNNSIKLPTNRNCFDFQITSDKNLTYTWSLYQFNNQQLEDRIDYKHFSIRKAYNLYNQDKNKNNQTMPITFEKKGITLNFRIFIQSTADLILQLTSLLFPILEQGPQQNQKQLNYKKSESRVEQITIAEQNGNIFTDYIESMNPSIINQQCKIEETQKNVIKNPNQKESESVNIVEENQQIKQAISDQKLLIQSSGYRKKQSKQYQNSEDDTDQILGTDSKSEWHVNHEEKDQSKVFSNPDKANEMVPLDNVIIQENSLVLGENIELSEAAPSNYSSKSDRQSLAKIKSFKKIGFVILLLFLIAGFVDTFILSSSKGSSAKIKANKKKKRRVLNVQIDEI